MSTVLLLLSRLGLHLRAEETRKFIAPPPVVK